MLIRIGLVSFIFASSAFADKLNLDIEAKDIFVKGIFAFQPGGKIQISGKDLVGKSYELNLDSKVQPEGTIQFTCQLIREGHKQSVSVMTKKGIEARLAEGPKEGPPTLKLGATWTE